MCEWKLKMQAFSYLSSSSSSVSSSLSELSVPALIALNVLCMSSSLYESHTRASTQVSSINSVLSYYTDSEVFCNPQFSVQISTDALLQCNSVTMGNN